MPPQRPQANYSKRPVKRVRLLKFGPRKTKSLFEEYFYGFLVAIFLLVGILLRAGGMSTYDAFVIGLWVAGIVWVARQVSAYYREKSGPAVVKRAKPAPPPATLALTGPLPSGMKPMIGPQWPLKSQKEAPPGNGGSQPNTPGKPKPAFVYERPTLPDRKPKLPANWPGAQDKKPKK